MFVAEHYAAFLAATTGVPGEPRKMAMLAVFDLIGAVLAGQRTTGARSAMLAAPRIWGAGDAPVWFTECRLPDAGATFVNASAASMLDLDDGHRAAAGHPGAGIIPAVLAAERRHRTGSSRVLTAIVLGYEIAIRASAARDLSRVDTLVSGRWVGQGVAAAVAWMRGLPEAQIAQAIAIAGTSAPDLGPVAYSRIMGNHLKEGIAWATATGMAAADLAEAGYTAPVDLFDNETLFDRPTLIDGLGDQWAIEQIYFKPYGCCRWAHAAIEATLALLGTYALTATSIDRIRIETFSRALQLNNEPHPQTLEAAQYSVPFCVALAALEGERSLLPLDEQALSHPQALALAERISIQAAPDLDVMFPLRAPARVELVAERKACTSTVLVPKGEPSNPLTRSELEAKFFVLAEPVLGRSRAARLLMAIAALDDEGAAALLLELETPVGRSPDQLAALGEAQI